MSRRGENIYLRKDGRWEGRYIVGRRPDGKPRFSSIYGRQYSEVKSRLILLKAQACREGADCVIFGNGSLKDWGDYWLEALVRPYVRPGTHGNYRQNLELHIYPSLGSANIRKIRPEQIQSMVDQLQKRLAPSVVQSIYRLLKSLLNCARENRVIKENPCFNIKLPKIRKKQTRVLSVTEQKKLENKLQETQDLEYLICLYTGLRVGEVCALRWEDVDLENRCLQVRHSIQRLPGKRLEDKSYLNLGAPKSECSVREIPLPAFLAAILEEKQKKEGGSSKDFLFPGKKGTYRDPRSMQHKLKKLCKVLGLRNVHMHTLRHTFATRCLEQGIHFEILCEFLGHSSPQITLRHYVHCTPEAKRKSMDRMHPMAFFL